MEFTPLPRPPAWRPRAPRPACDGRGAASPRARRGSRLGPAPPGVRRIAPHDHGRCFSEAACHVKRKVHPLDVTVLIDPTIRRASPTRTSTWATRAPAEGGRRAAGRWWPRSYAARFSWRRRDSPGIFATGSSPAGRSTARSGCDRSARPERQVPTSAPPGPGAFGRQK